MVDKQDQDEMAAERPSKPPLTALDRTKAVEIEDVDMYVFQQRHKITDQVMSQEHFMVIRSKNGRKYVFRQVIERPKPGKILT